MILLTGGAGLLGRELQRLLPCYAPPRQLFDVTKNVTLPENVHLIVHCAAYTDVLKAETEREEAYEVNVMGTLNMVELGLPIVYISTEYVFDGGRGNYAEEDCPNPRNYYSVTKEIGERVVCKAKRHLIIRTLFKPRPFEHPRALVDQWTTGDYVDVIAPKIADAVKMFEADELNGFIHIGTEKKTTFDLASRSRKVDPAYLAEMPVMLPRDTSLSTTKWAQLSHS